MQPDWLTLFCTACIAFAAYMLGRYHGYVRGMIDGVAEEREWTRSLFGGTCGFFEAVRLYGKPK